tara:strand:+ start:327 stop:566 length:240 start_codon:yes stop_codon:yes gene_type:complete
MDKDKVIELLGDIAWFSGILILQSNMYNEKGTKEDSEAISVMLRQLSEEIGLTKEDIIAIETTADNKIKEQLNAKIEKV